MVTTVGPTTTEEEVEVETQTELNKLNKMLPKSYPEFGAYVAQVAIDEKQSKELGTGDADTLEMLGPLELATTTTAAPTTTTMTTTTAKEIRFFINTQNNKQLLKDHKNNNSFNGPKNVLEIGQKESQRSSTPSIDSSLVDMKSLYSIGKDLNEQNQKKVIRKKVYRIRNRTKMPTILDKSHIKFTERPEYREKTVTIERPFTENFTIANKYKIVDLNDHGQIKTNKSQHLPQIVWKRRSKPKFLIRAKIKPLDKLKADEVTGIKWWYQAQPEYCRIPIYVVKDCAQPKPQKRWSFNPRDNRCYQYEDSCPQYKANSFKSSNDCFRKCYRIEEKI